MFLHVAGALSSENQSYQVAEHGEIFFFTKLYFSLVGWSSICIIYDPCSVSRDDALEVCLLGKDQ